MQRVLVIKPSSIGDILHAFPAVAWIRQQLGRDVRISWVVNESLRGVVELSPDVDRIISFPRSRMWQFSSLRSFLHELRSEQYDIALDYQGLLKSGLIAYFSGAPMRIGFSHARECSPLFYNRRVRIAEMHSHAVEKNLQLTREAFDFKDEPSWGLGMLALEGSRRDGRHVAVCFSSRWNSKNWSPAFIASVLDELSKLKPEAAITLIGSQADFALGEQLISQAKVARPVNMAGKSSFMELAGIVAGADVMLTVDSGPMHLAASCGTPCVALFGATDAVLTGPYGAPGQHKVFCSACDMSPCFKRDCPRHADCSAGTSALTVAEALAVHLSDGLIQ